MGSISNPVASNGIFHGHPVRCGNWQGCDFGIINSERPIFVGMTRLIEVVEAAEAREIEDARFLMRAFVAWHRRRHADDIQRVDRYFNAAAFEAELAGLPGNYKSPEGALLVAYSDGRPAGCVAVRPLGDNVCEMKRMFVLDEYRGHGIGRALAETIISAARSAGHKLMRLDTGRDQTEAISLYTRQGFKRIEHIMRSVRTSHAFCCFSSSTCQRRDEHFARLMPKATLSRS